MTKLGIALSAELVARCLHARATNCISAASNRAVTANQLLGNLNQ
jgi:hypothetical protein